MRVKKKKDFVVFNVMTHEAKMADIDELRVHRRILLFRFLPLCMAFRMMAIRAICCAQNLAGVYKNSSAKIDGSFSSKAVRDFPPIFGFIRSHRRH